MCVCVCVCGVEGYVVIIIMNGNVHVMLSKDTINPLFISTSKGNLPFFHYYTHTVQYT